MRYWFHGDPHKDPNFLRRDFYVRKFRWLWGDIRRSEWLEFLGAQRMPYEDGTYCCVCLRELRWHRLTEFRNIDPNYVGDGRVYSCRWHRKRVLAEGHYELVRKA